jgi:Fe-S-cluster containining protein
VKRATLHVAAARTEPHLPPIPTPDGLPSCRECAACCRDAGDGTVLVSAGDLLRWRREKATVILAGFVPGHFGQQGFRARADGACIHLGSRDQPNDCSIYETRAESCRSLERGSAQCLAYARMAAPRLAPAQLP